jgi:hypothetical protein
MPLEEMVMDDESYLVPANVFRAWREKLGVLRGKIGFAIGRDAMPHIWTRYTPRKFISELGEVTGVR